MYHARHATNHAMSPPRSHDPHDNPPAQHAEHASSVRVTALGKCDMDSLRSSMGGEAIQFVCQDSFAVTRRRVYMFDAV